MNKLDNAIGKSPSKEQSLSSDARKIVVTQSSCSHCGGNTVEVYHPSFPAMRINSASALQVAERLSIELETELSFARTKANFLQRTLELD